MNDAFQRLADALTHQSAFPQPDLQRLPAYFITPGEDFIQAGEILEQSRAAIWSPAHDRHCPDNLTTVGALAGDCWQRGGIETPQAGNQQS